MGHWAHQCMHAIQGCLQGCVVYVDTQDSDTRKATHVVECSAVTVLKFLIFERKNLHFHFVLGPANYVAVPNPCTTTTSCHAVGSFLRCFRRHVSA